MPRVNPNEYDEGAYLELIERLAFLVHELWSVGADEEDIKATVDSAIQDAQ